MDEVQRTLEEEGASDVRSIDIAPGHFVQSMLFCSGKSPGHLKAMAERLLYDMKLRRVGTRINFSSAPDLSTTRARALSLSQALPPS